MLSTLFFLSSSKFVVIFPGLLLEREIFCKYQRMLSDYGILLYVLYDKNFPVSNYVSWQVKVT